MILLTVQDLVRQFDVEPVLNKVSFDISEGDKIGLVGPNGAGKSTLLRILMRQDDADSGNIEHPASLDIAMLEQEADFPPRPDVAGRGTLGSRPFIRIAGRIHPRRGRDGDSQR
ncbi:MAG: hypothetical protein CMJ46_04135 [Planctomyces sp.]|nr:hypothetical protein [Planctomyces sp.]